MTSFRNWLTGNTSLCYLREEFQGEAIFTVVTHMKIIGYPRCKELEPKQSTVVSLRLKNRNKNSGVLK